MAYAILPYAGRTPIIDPMSKEDKKRTYPPVYEKIIPAALWLIGGFFVLVLVITISVALGS
jgi:hypothetical protein